MSDVSPPKWLNSPPTAPLSESILTSGLVSEKYVVKTKPTSPERPQHVAVPMTGKPRRLPPKTAYRSAPPEKVRVLPQIGIDDFAVPARRAEIPTDYKPPPIEYTTENRRIYETPKRKPEERRVLGSSLGDLQQRESRTSVRQLRSELDAAVADVGVDVVTGNCRQTEQSVKLLNTYNYVFNQLILQEKQRDSERAVLLRRLQQFFVDQASLAPHVRSEMDSAIAKMKDEIAALTQKLSDETIAKETALKKVEEAAHDLRVVKEELEKTIEESNKKDIIIDSNKFDLESIRTKMTFLQCRVMKKKEKCGKLKEQISEAADHNKSISEQLDAASETIEKYRRQEVGYLPMYQQELKRANEAEARVKVLEEMCLRSEAKVDDGTETEEVSVPVKRTKTSRKSRRSCKFHLSMNLNPITIDSKNKPELICTEVETQTDPVTQKEEEQVSNQDEIRQNKIEAQSSLLDVHFNTPPDYPYTGIDILRIPDILPLIIPVFAGAVAKPNPNMSPLVFSLSCFDKVPKQKKPLSWGVQLIHSFLMDAFLRSETFELESLETVFMEWLNVQYKLPHLTRQMAADLSYFLCQFVSQDKFVELFYSMLLGQYSRAQIVFMATVYSFTVNLTYPNYVTMIENMDETKTDSGFDKVQIHIKVVYQIIASSFTKEMAEKYIREKLNKEQPLVSYIDFLREMAIYFSQKHKLMYQQAKDLLTLCGCLDVTKVHFAPFVSFLVFVGEGKNAKYHWESIQMNKKERKEFIPIGNVLTFCATKKDPMIKLLSIFPLGPSLSTLKSYTEISRELFNQFLARFVGGFCETLWRLPESIFSKVCGDIENLKIAFMHADLQQVLWFYRVILIRVDRLLMEERGSVPYPDHPTRSTIRQLIEYFDRTESVAFAFINV